VSTLAGEIEGRGEIFLFRLAYHVFAVFLFHISNITCVSLKASLANLGHNEGWGEAKWYSKLGQCDGKKASKIYSSAESRMYRKSMEKG